MHSRVRAERIFVNMACADAVFVFVSSSAIQAKTGYTAELELIDLADFTSVKAFCDRLADVPVDILVANAGVAQSVYSTTTNGWEMK